MALFVFKFGLLQCFQLRYSRFHSNLRRCSFHSCDSWWSCVTRLQGSQCRETFSNWFLFPPHRFTSAKIQLMSHKPYQNSDWIEDCFEFSILQLRQVESVKVYCNHWRCSLQGCALRVAVPSDPWCLSLILLLVVLEVWGHLPWVRTGWPIQSSHKENFTINQDGPARFVYS